MTDDILEYPKWITTPAGARMIVQDAAEEAIEMAALAPDPTPEPKPENSLMAPASDARTDLVAKAEAKGIKVDGRWSDARLSEEIQKAVA